MFCISVKCENTNYKYWKRQCSRKYYEGIGLFSILHNKDLCGFTGYLVLTGQWILEDWNELDMKLVYRKQKNSGEKTSWKMTIYKYEGKNWEIHNIDLREQVVRIEGWKNWFKNVCYSKFWYQQHWNFRLHHKQVLHYFLKLTLWNLSNYMLFILGCFHLQRLFLCTCFFKFPWR